MGWWRAWRWVCVGSLILLMLTGCNGSNGTDQGAGGGGGNGTGQGTSGGGATSRLLLRVTARDDGQSSGVSRAASPIQARQVGSGFTLLLVSVSGADIPTPVVAECLIPGPSPSCQITEPTPTTFEVAVALAVPPGVGRLIVVTIYDGTGTAVRRGSVTRDLIQAVQEIPVDLVPVNRAPLANAGQDQTVTVGTTVQLDGRGSTDADGNPLTFRWSLLMQPAGSGAALNNASSATPTFVAEVRGTYMAQLLVNDGSLDSAPRTVMITVTARAPRANAGEDQTVMVGTTVGLSGAGSTDVDGSPLTFTWFMLLRPAGSQATLSDATGVTPTFVVDRPGTYMVQLIVHNGAADSLPDVVTIDTMNSAPVARAGLAQTVPAGSTVTLQGNGSSDVDGDPLQFAWFVRSIPSGSQATLSNPAAVNPTFIADRPGTYVVQLVVNDGRLTSVPAMVTVSTINTAPVANPGSDQTVTVGATVQLDGRGSTDADGNPLTFRWSLLVQPAGSGAALNNASSATPTFVAEVRGTYMAQLLVNDGSLDSAPRTVMITVTAAVSTFAGSAVAGAVDGSGATARFSNPVNVALDAQGNVFVADFDNGLVRQITPTGVVSTIVQTFVDPQQTFQRPFGITVTPQAVFVQTDTNNDGFRDGTTGTVWDINVTTGRTTVVARDLGRPRGLGALLDGRLVLSDLTHHTVSILDPGTGMVTQLAGTADMPGFQDGTGAAARFSRPYGVTVLPNGDILVADQNNHRIRRITIPGGVVTTYAGDGTEGFLDGDRLQAQFRFPQALAADAMGNVFVSDIGNARIRRIGAAGLVSTAAGNGMRDFQDGPAPEAEFFGQEGIAVLPDGSKLYVADGTGGQDGTPFNRVRLVQFSR